jgi:hypothetical protein
VLDCLFACFAEYKWYYFDISFDETIGHQECGSKLTEEDRQQLYKSFVTRNEERSSVAKPSRYALVQTYILKNSKGTSTLTADTAAIQVTNANKLYTVMNYKWIMDKPIFIESDEVRDLFLKRLTTGVLQLQPIVEPGHSHRKLIQ